MASAGVYRPLARYPPDTAHVQGLPTQKAVKREIASGKGGVLGGELRQDLLAEEPNGPQHLRLIHPGPLQAEDQRRDAETLAIAGDLLRDPRRVADDEPVARQLLEALREAFTRGQRFVLLPSPVGPIFRVEERGGLRERRGRLGRHVALLDQRRLGRRGDRKSTRLNSSHSQISYAV